MLKKLVKHGNSSALILDRSILALLDIDENAVLKLRIEGNTLVIKAAEQLKATDAIMAEIESLHTGFSDSLTPVREAIELATKRNYKAAESDPEKMKVLEDWRPGTANSAKLQEAFGKIMEKYQKEVALLKTESFTKELQALTEQCQEDTTSKAFVDGLLALRLKHSPKLKEMDNEMKEAAKKLGCTW